MNIPPTARWKRSVMMAQNFIFDVGICCLPVDPFALYWKCNWILLSYQEAGAIFPRFYTEKIMPQKIDAKTFLPEDGIFITIYNEKRDLRRIRWTLGHEIGHIVLGHFKYSATQANIGLTDEEREVLEDEANIFCAELLSPFCVLKELKITSQEQIRKECDLSWVAATNRQKSIKNHWYNDLYSASEDMFKIQFADFLIGTKIDGYRPWKEIVAKHIERCAETPLAYDLDEI